MARALSSSPRLQKLTHASPHCSLSAGENARQSTSFDSTASEYARTVRRLVRRIDETARSLPPNGYSLIADSELARTFQDEGVPLFEEHRALHAEVVREANSLRQDCVQSSLALSEAPSPSADIWVQRSLQRAETFARTVRSIQLDGKTHRLIGLDRDVVQAQAQQLEVTTTSLKRTMNLGQVSSTESTFYRSYLYRLATSWQQRAPLRKRFAPAKRRRPY